VVAEAVQTAGISDPSAFVRSTWLIALLPFIAAWLTLFIGKRTPGKGTIYGIAAVGAAFVLSLGVLWSFVQGERGFYEASVPWFQIGQLHMELGVYVDGLTAVMLVVVTAISLAVQVYSLGYMKGDVRYTWFFAVLSLFTAAMLVVVISNNLFELLVGWEVMGVCSYLLIGHWWEEHVNSSSGIKAFITTRIGDVPFTFGIFALVFMTGFETSNIREIGEVIAGGGVSVALVSAAALLTFGGAIGKSAQFPLHVWLPDAMAGPTPVSALIHAATMVAAGVYLVGRLYVVFLDADPAVLQLVGITGAITMVIGALMALVQDDIKRVIAYSTISQLAYMMAGMAMGPAGRTAGFFQLFAHAFFKALLFLAAGSVIHAVHTNDMSEMGGLRRRMPITFWTFLIAALAAAGVPPLAGFWSKDELITVASEQGHEVLFVAMLGTAVLTAFYMIRAVMLTFAGEYRGHGHPHESPASMTSVLVALATATVFVGLLGAPQLGAVFGQWVFFEEIEEALFVPWIAVASTLAAVLGILAGYYLYRRYREPDPLSSLGGAYTLVSNKFYLDDVYWKGIVRPTRDEAAAGVYRFDQKVIDRIVNGAASVTRLVSRVIRRFDDRVIDGAVNGVANIAGYTGGILRYIQSGNVQRYAAFLFAGVVVLAIIFTRI
jgi:NADH-quinone oxidoreductase subunit L